MSIYAALKLSPQSLCSIDILYITISCGGMGRQAAQLFSSCHHKDDSQINNSEARLYCNVHHKGNQHNFGSDASNNGSSNKGDGTDCS